MMTPDEILRQADERIAARKKSEQEQQAAPAQDAPVKYLTERELGFEPNTDGAIVRGFKNAGHALKVGANLYAQDAGGAADALKAQHAYEQANPSNKEGQELMQAFQDAPDDSFFKGVGAMGGEVAKDWREARGLVDKLKSVGKNVVGAGSLLGEQVGNMVAPMAAMGMGAVAGGAAGAAVGGAAAPATGAVGSVVGGVAGASFGNALQEAGFKSMQDVQAAGIDLQNVQAVEKYLQENGSAIRQGAAIKGTVLGTVDRLTLGIGRALLTKPLEMATERALIKMGVDVADKAAVAAAKKTAGEQIASHVATDAAYQAANKGVQKYARNAAAFAVDPAGEFAGEYLGSGLGFGEWSVKDAGLEALMGLGQSGAMYAGQKAYEAATSPLRGQKPGALPEPAAGAEGAAGPQEPTMGDIAGQSINPVDTGAATFEDLATPREPQPVDPYTQWDEAVRQAQHQGDAASEDLGGFEWNPGAAPGAAERVDAGLEFARDFDTGGLELEPPLSRQMGLRTAEAGGGALEGAAALAVDSGASPAAQAQFIASTGRELSPLGQAAQLGGDVIDVEAREVTQPQGLSFTRRIAQGGGGQGQAGPRQQAALPAPTNLREGLQRIRQQRVEAARMAQMGGQESASTAQVQQEGPPLQAGAAPEAVQAEVKAGAENVGVPRQAAGGGVQAAKVAPKQDSPAEQAAKGQAQFSKRAFADGFIEKHGLGETHHVVKQRNGNFRVEAKPVQQQEPSVVDAPLKVGTTPGNAEAVTVRDGVVHIGDEQAYDYESGEPVRVAGDASKDAIVQALKKAQAVTNTQKFYGLEKAQAEEVSPQERLQALEAQMMSKAGVDNIDTAMKSKKVSVAHKAQRNRLLKQVGEVAPGQADPAPQAATHQEVGQAPEVATAGVIGQSMREAADSRNTTPAQIRKWLMGELSAAIGRAQEAGRIEAAQADGFERFDVPGDGKFKVANSVHHLESFQKRVNNSAGFRGDGTAHQSASVARDFGVQNGSSTKAAALNAMVQEGDFEAARDYAQATGQKLQDAKASTERLQELKQFIATGQMPSGSEPVGENLRSAAIGETREKDGANLRKETGPFGPIFTGYTNDPEGAIELHKGISTQPTHTNPPFLGDKVGAGQANATSPSAAGQGQQAAVTQADVDAAKQQATEMIGAAIDAMPAGDVNRIAKKFLPTMGLKPTVSKARNKVAFVDPKVNLEASAAELGVQLPDAVKRALDADMQGLVVQGWQEASSREAVPGQQAAFTKSGDFYNYSGPRTQELAQELGLTVTEHDGVPMVSVPRHKLFDAQDALEAAGIEATFDAAAPKAQPGAAAIEADRRPSQWPYAVAGWKMVGGGKDVPGYASEKSAGIAIKQNSEWRDLDAVVLPFSYNDGSVFGPYAKTSTRYAVLVRDAKKNPKQQAQKAPAATETAAKEKRPTDFIEAPGGGLDYGEITPEMGKAMRRQAGKIRLQQGVQNADGSGWGLAHIEARHGEQIRGLGYETVADFVAQIAKNFQEVWQAAGVQLLVTAKDGRKNVMFIQLAVEKDGDFYRVNSAFPVRREDYETRQKMKKLWPESEPQAKATGQPSAFAVGNAEKSSSADPNAVTQSATSVPATPASGKSAVIEDFGQKLEGARKDMPPSLQEEITDEQIASQPLSKIWPANAHEAIEDDLLAAVAFAARAEIPAKPRVSYRVKAWVQQVKLLRAMVRDFGPQAWALIRGSRQLDAFAAKAQLLEQLPRSTWGRVSWVEQFPNAYRFDEAGKQVPTPSSIVSIDGKTHTFEGVGKIGPDEVAKVKELLGGAAPKKGGLTAKDFEIRYNRRTGNASINRKGDSEYRALKEFIGKDGVTQARAYLKGDVAELEAAWEAVKARDNVAKSDTRSQENRARAGQDWRKGKDATPEMFEKAFEFRGVQFGNWVAQGKGGKDRQGMLNEAYDALHDLADLLNMPTQALSLNGSLGLAFGARGSGKAAAHFEPNNLVINLTKTKGAGSLAHEWFHALDNYFARMREGGKEVAATGKTPYREGNFITYRPERLYVPKNGLMRMRPLTRAELLDKFNGVKGSLYDPDTWHLDPQHPDGVRPQVEQAFAALVQALNASPMAKRASVLDKSPDAYWSQIIERGARSFENYVISKMAQQGRMNDFLANVRSWDAWQESGKNPERYPYLKPEEEAPVVAAFDKLFDTIEHKRKEDGKTVLFSRSASTQAAYEARIDALQSFAGQQAQTADQHALSEAQSRLDAGADPEQVRQDTGWHQGNDGKWRFEINDADAKLDVWMGAVSLNDLRQANNGKWIAPNDFAEQHPEHELARRILRADDLYKRVQGTRFTGRVTLGQVLNHPALFAAYPGLKNIRILVSDSEPIGEASYFPSENAILMGPAKPDIALSVLLHEIQHGIQNIEDFATGGSPEVHGSDYRRLAGEVEARNTQARQRMTDAERRATPPSATADVADSDVIVTFNGKEMHSAPKPANAANQKPIFAESLQKTPVNQVRAAITKAYGKLLDKLEAKGLVTLVQSQDEAIEAAAKARAKATGKPLAEVRDELLASVRGESDEISMSIYTDAAGKIGRALDAIGLRSSIESSAISSSTYVIVESPEYTATGGLNGEVVKIRISDHKLPSSYAAPDFEVQVGATHEGVNFANAAGEWFEAVQWAGKRFDKEPAGAAKRLIAAKAERANNALSAQQQADLLRQRIMDEHRARLGKWLDSLPEGALWGNARRGGYVAVKDGKMIGRFDGQTATGEGQPWYGSPYPADAQKALKPLRSDIEIKRSANGAIEGFHDPVSGKTFLIADALTEETAPGTLMHEVGIHMAADSDGKMQKLIERAGDLREKWKNNPFVQQATSRMEQAGETSNEEFLAYVVTQYENNRAKMPVTLTGLARDFIAAVKAWLHSKGWLDTDSLTVADLAAIARANAKRLANNPATGNRGTFDGADPDINHYAASNPTKRPGTAQDKAVMQAIADGKSARDVLRVVVNTSKNPFNRQVARLLLKSGATPSIVFGHIGKTENGSPIHGQYRGKTDSIHIAGSAEYAAERIFLHEAMHSATMRALKKPGLHATQLRHLYNHVSKDKRLAGFYGIKNVDEFVAEVFTNPDFQAALRKMKAPSESSGIKTAWDSFVRILRSILGLNNDSHSALAQALNLGVGVVREDMVLRKRGGQGVGTMNMATELDTAEAQRQFAQTERAYGGRAAYDKAKAAGKTKLNYGQWVQVRTPNFKAWFGDWEAVRAQQRLDAMQPLQVRVPDEWRGLGHAELRQKMAEELDRMVREQVKIEHPELGEIRVGRVGAKKSEGSARDPAKSLVAADIEALIPASVYARSVPSRGGDGPDISGYSTLLAHVQVDDVPLVASFTVRHQSDGKWYYNAVALHDAKEKAQDSYERPDQQAGSSVAPIAGLSEFIRRPLARVNPDEVSKVVDPATGEPLVVYHGTHADITQFRANEALGGSIFFSPDPNEDAAFTGAAGANVVPAFLLAKNPRKGVVRSYGEVNAAVRAKERGQDAIRVRDAADGVVNWAVFTPTQIKSATGNNGNFDPNDPDIANFGADDITRIKDGALSRLDQAMNHPGTVSLWDKTVGTMRNLAERNPLFKPVYEAAQGFIDDVAMLASDAAEMAPRVLPRVESWRDLTKKAISPEDNKAIGKPLFEGTLLWARDEQGKPTLVSDLQERYAKLSADDKAQKLLHMGKLDAGILKMWRGLPLDQYEKLVNSRFESQALKPGVVWSDKELKSLFGATDNQVSLYREVRSAIDRSIDMTARADMLRVLGKEFAPMRDMVLEQESLQDAMELLTQELQQRVQGMDADKWLDLHNQVIDRATKARELQDAGYMPLSRFGRYTLDVVSQDGERQFFGMYETRGEANRAAMAMRSAFPGAAVSQGTMSQEAFKLFAGITPESLELFGNMIGLDSEGGEARDRVFQEYLKLTKNNHSAMKRLMHRKGVAGFSEDVGRTLAGFVYSNARQAAGAINAGRMDEAVNAIPKEQGELKDVAMKLRSYIQDPQEEGQAVRGMLFAQYLGGSVASAFVNMTQPFAVTMPWLSQYGGMKQASVQISKALKDMATKGTQYEADLAAALKHAEEVGIVAPQEIHQLMAQARGAGALRSGDGTKTGNARAAASNAWERTKVAWGQPFALAELFNRRSTFIAAYRIAKAQGMSDPAAFASRAVEETQFVYSKANKMRWGRGAVGGALMTFKSYSIQYMELLHRMWSQGGPEGKRAVGWAMAMLLLMGGGGGLPFMEDLEDLIDGIAQMMGVNLSTKQKRQEFLRSIVGKELGDFMEQGVSGLPGMPVDVSGRLGLGNLIPGTGLLMQKQDRERDLLEVAGPAGDLIKRGFTGGMKFLRGDVTGAAMDVAPTAVRNAAKGVDMALSGMYKDTKGYKVVDTTLDEALAKFAGFQPKSVAEVQEANGFMLRSKSFYQQTSADIKAQWADALFRQDDAALQRVRERLAAWNGKNPEQPIVVKMPDVWRKVREMGKDRTQRIADTAPKALRQQMREMALEVGG